jgi:ribosomal protein S18 acetylase RimI-like enzyme
MKEKYSIKEMKKEDISKVVKLVKESFDVEYLIPSIYRAKGIESFISYELENKLGVYKYFAFWHDDEIIGFSEFKIYNPHGIVFLNIIAVSNGHKNKGIGRQLLEFAKKRFIEEGFKSIQLDVYKSNLIAIKWYTRYGFKEESSNMFYKITLKPTSKLASDGPYLKNYSQFKVNYEFFGFYFLEVGIELLTFKFGFIENDLFWRGNYDSDIAEKVAHLAGILKVADIYLIGSSSDTKDCVLLDEIIRMELNLQYD